VDEEKEGLRRDRVAGWKRKKNKNTSRRRACRKFEQRLIREKMRWWRKVEGGGGRWSWEKVEELEAGMLKYS
jgi:hypothetical protein